MSKPLRSPDEPYAGWEKQSVLSWRSAASRLDRLPFTTAAFAAVLLAGLLVRAASLRTGFDQQNSDTAVVYLMARHVAHGDLSVFYWGQSYGGTIFQLAAGALMSIFGSSFVVLQVVEIAFWLAACLLLRSIVATAITRPAGDLAAAMLWLASPYVVSISYTDPGFYGDGLAIGLASIWLTQRSGWPPVARALALGFVAGLGFWTTPLTLAFTVPAVLVDMRASGLRRDRFSLLVGGALVGASPWIWANMHTHFASLHRLGGSQGTVIGRYVHGFTQLVPTVAGQTPGSAGGRLAAALVALAIVAGVAVATWRRNTTLACLCVAGLLIPAVVAVSGVAVVPGAGRYATLMIPAAAAVVAWGLVRLRIHAAALAALCCVVPAWTCSTIWNDTGGFRPVAHPATGAPITVLAGYLERTHRTAVFADYWISYLLSAATQERVRAAALAPAVYRRQPAYEQAALRPRHTTVVVFAGEANDQILTATRGLPPHTRTKVGRYAVWTFAGRLDVRPLLTAIAVP